MPPPDLNSLQKGDQGAWDAAFNWLWPTVFSVAQLKLHPFCPGDVEDVAIESLEELVEKVHSVRTVEELKPLAASIAHNRAVSLLRERFAKKRGQGATQSLDEQVENGGPAVEIAVVDCSLDSLGQQELSVLLDDLRRGLKPEYRDVLQDFFVSGLTYDAIAGKHKMAMGSVGVYLKRGLEALRRSAERQPTLLKELESFLR